MPPEIMPWHMTQLVNPEYTRVDLVKEGANSQAHIKLFKGKGGTQTMNFEEFIAKMSPEHAKIVTDHIEKILKDQETITADAVEKARKEAVESVAKNATPAEQTEEEILKSVQDPAIRLLLETQIAKAKAAEEIVRKHAVEKLELEAITKAKEVSIPGASHEQLADIYKSLNDLPEVRDNVFGILKSAAAVSAEGGAFAAIGKSAGEVEVAGSADAAWEQIEKAATVHKSAGMGHAQAIAKAIQENPELYTKYING